MILNLKNQKNHIFNQPYSKEEYEEKVKELNLNSKNGLEEARKKFEDFAASTLPNAFLMNLSAVSPLCFESGSLTVIGPSGDA